MLNAQARWLTNDGARVFVPLESGEVIRSEGSSISSVARIRSSIGAKLSLNSGVLPLPAGVIAVAANSDLLRLESSGETWKIVERAKLNAIRSR
jgi:hypothetical protein